MKTIRAVCFDLDDTLIDYNSWVHLNLNLGVTKEQDTEMYNDYHDGKMSYEEWIQKILQIYLQHEDATLEGIRKKVARFSYNDGAKEAIAHLRERGYMIFLLSGSYDVFVQMVADDLQIEYAKATNTMEFDVQGRLVAIHTAGHDGLTKLRYLEALCEMTGIPLDQCACVGDGLNDLELFRATKRGITFKGMKIENEAWKVIESLHDLKKIFA